MQNQGRPHMDFIVTAVVFTVDDSWLSMQATTIVEEFSTD